MLKLEKASMQKRRPSAAKEEICKKRESGEKKTIEKKMRKML